MPLTRYRAENSRQIYNDHYNQSGRGMNVFHGQQIQKGYGIGSIFSGLMKTALPMIKRGALALGKTALDTGLKVARDRLNGQSMRQSAKNHFEDFGQQFISNIKDKKGAAPKNNSRKNKRKLTTTPKVTSAKRRKLATKKSNTGDIFN